MDDPGDDSNAELAPETLTDLPLDFRPSRCKTCRSKRGDATEEVETAATQPAATTRCR